MRLAWPDPLGVEPVREDLLWRGHVAANWGASLYDLIMPFLWLWKTQTLHFGRFLPL